MCFKAIVRSLYILNDTVFSLIRILLLERSFIFLCFITSIKDVTEYALLSNAWHNSLLNLIKDLSLSQGILPGCSSPRWSHIWNMAADWLGSIVSINCGDSLGVYQGRVSAVDQVSQTISLTRPFHNGVKCLVPEVTFRWVSRLILPDLVWGPAELEPRPECRWCGT